MPNKAKEFELSFLQRKPQQITFYKTVFNQFKIHLILFNTCRA